MSWYGQIWPVKGARGALHDRIFFWLIIMQHG